MELDPNIKKMLENSDGTLPDWAKSAMLAAEIVSQKNRAELWDADSNDRAEFLKLTLSLTTAKEQMGALQIPFKFKSLRVQSATDATTSVELIRGKSYDNVASLALKQNDTVTFRSQNYGFLYWAAQSGKSITIIFAVDADFKQGSLVLNQTGGVIVGEGTTVTSAAYKSVTITTAGIILPQLTTRTVGTLQNQGVIPIYVGAVDVTGSAGLKPGYRVLPGESVVWKNSAALYGITDSGTNASISITEEA